MGFHLMEETGNPDVSARSSHQGLFSLKSQIVTSPLAAEDAMMCDTSVFHARLVICAWFASDCMVTVG
jgi:hypothetical protein